MIESQAYGWQGKLVDANGQTGTIDADLPPSREGVARWRIKLAQRDLAAQTFEGRTDLTATPEGMRFGRQENGKEEQLPWTVTLRDTDAGIFAEAALVGEYSVDQARTEIPLSQGVLILWRFT